MTTKMDRSVMMTLLHVLLLSHGALCLGAVDLPWQDQLCCDSPSARLAAEGEDAHVPERNRSVSDLPHPHPRCSYRKSTAKSHPEEFSGGTCLDILCRIDEDWQNLTCDLQAHGPAAASPEAALTAASLQRLLSQDGNAEGDAGRSAPDNPVVCKAEDSFTCTVALDNPTSVVTAITVSVSDSVAPPVLLRIPARPVKPSAPTNLSHIQTIETELILHWDNPSDLDGGPLRYEVRYSSNAAHPVWQVVSALREPRSALDLKPKLNYSVQVRCSGLDNPPRWSDWSESYHIYLDTVSYIPEKVVARPGENVTVYCVFNDHNVDASMAVWKLNFKELHRSQYHAVNQRVSQITLRPSGTQMYDLLQCTQGWTIPYSQIYVKGTSIDINCETNGDIDAMDCSWNDTELIKPEFKSRWADLACDVMEERERAGETVGEMGPDCLQVDPKKKTCTIRPLRMNCYKLWLEVQSPLGPILSKPVYLTTRDHVKPHPPSNVRAESWSSGVLVVTWEPPPLPVEGLQCQFRYQSTSAVRAPPEWKVQSPVRVREAKVAVSDMCRDYVVQVRCMHTDGIGYWSEWSDSVYSTPRNSRAPERGPDFWRILQDDPYRNQTNVTLLFKHLQISGLSYCVNGFIVQHRSSSGSVTRERIELASSYSFEWNQMPQTVTVEAYNSLGSSADNVNMMLERQPKRRCVRSFSVRVINSTCVSLWWTLLDNSLPPQFMVVQWSPRRQQDSDHHKVQSGDTWARLPYTDRPTYLRGDFFGSEECDFFLYPVFADGEGEPVFATVTAKRGDPAVYQMLMIISFLSIVLCVTLVISQHQMKKFVWKDVPNPNKCSWAKGLDLRKLDTFDHMFHRPEGLQAWPLLLPSENISTVVIVDKVDLSALNADLAQTPLVPLTPESASSSSVSLVPGLESEADQPQPVPSEEHPGAAPPFALNLDTLTSLSPEVDLVEPPGAQPLESKEYSAQSSVTYTTVLLRDPQQEQQLHYKDGSGGGSGSSSSDEGNFSANNSDISGSFPGGLWELDDPRRSCSYNSVEELSETSEQEDEGEVRGEKDLYYLGMEYPGEESEEDEEGTEVETKSELLKNVVLSREGCSTESRPLLELGDSTQLPPTCGFSPFYLPQFRTAQCDGQDADQPQDGEPQL